MVTATATGALGPCPDAGLMPANGDLARVRTAVLCLVNEEREHAGESPLRVDGALEASAQAHSDDMSARAYFEHVSPDGSTPLQRMRASDYIAAGDGFEVGENIAWGTYTLATPRAIVGAWMASPEHRANILDARFRDTGIGVNTQLPASLGGGAPGALYTEDFGVLTGAQAARARAHAPTATSGNGARRSNAVAHRPRSAAAHRPRPADRLRPSTLNRTTRRSKRHGSTRRKVRHRHRLRARHRTRHRRAARRRGRERADQRSRRRRR